MSIERIISVLAQGSPSPLPSRVEWLTSSRCEGAKFHSPAPMLIQPIALGSAVARLVLGQPVVSSGAETVYLCSTCRDNLTVYLCVLYAHSGSTPDSVRRDFGNLTRSMGDRAWKLHTDPAD